jgi:glycosyltransferase involved in cell wall biosynthesis
VALLATFGGSFPPLVVKRAVLYKPKFGIKFRTRRINAIITNSCAVREVLGRIGVDPAKVRVVYNPRALPDMAKVAAKTEALRSEFLLDPARPVVGTVGNGTPDKGFQFLVEAAPKILAEVQGVQFVLVGPHAGHLEARVKALGLSEDFRLTGFRTDAPDIMALFDLFVFPSVHKDTCPNVVLEAMSLGVPVVSSDLTGMDEILPLDAGVAVMFKAGDSDSLAAAVVSLLKDPARRREMGAAARRRIETHHDPDDKVREVIGLYDEVIG